MPRDALPRFPALHARPGGLVRRIAGHTVKRARLKKAAQQGAVPQVGPDHLHDTGKAVMLHALAAQCGGVLLKLHGKDARGLAPQRPQQGDHPAARAQLRAPLPFFRHGKIRQQNGIRIEPVDA